MDNAAFMNVSFSAILANLQIFELAYLGDDVGSFPGEVRVVEHLELASEMKISRGYS